MGCSDPKNDSDDWEQWRNFVLKELERLNNNMDALRDKQENSRNNISVLEAKIYTVVAIITLMISIAVPVVLHFV
jgi:hypothetical protein